MYSLYEQRSLQDLQVSAPVQFVTSSRTDKGVHALCNAVHVDLKHRSDGVAYHPDVVTTVMNQNMVMMKEPVRVLKTRRVADDFHCRFRARCRSYVYRLSICRQPEQKWTLAYTPMEFMHSCFVSVPIVDTQLTWTCCVRGRPSCLALITTGASQRRSSRGRIPVKTVSIDVRPGRGFLQEYSPFYQDQFDHWDLCYNSHSFLYKQIRKMTSVILAVGRGRLDTATVRDMLDRPGEKPLKDTNLQFESTENIDEDVRHDLQHS
ncbi:hypothetical protein NP493_5g00004 [Ridgeia piscesae]|uniref:tRNA pseudouridine synthase n=1 Tax=Ridgeia piscesae TaxID=27915 RepID=A0AAD9PFU6_RIDPI|nr:hypothetical protein NP493_5g00004 [Ridgeia piscesae]